MAEKKTRKLAAILFADIQGYSALMEKDENTASGLLSKFRSVLTEKVTEHGGRIVNFYGDGCLAVFESPLQSVKCAASSQNVFLTEPKVPVRIGLHSGVVVFEDDNVYGDSINQASRVESIGLAGSVLMSEHIRAQIKNHPEYQTQLLGTYEFKNIEEPMKVFALTNKGFTVPQASDIKGKLKTKANNGLYKWLVPALIIVLAIAGLGTWQSAVENSGLNTANTLSSPLSQEMREKRMAVMVFENQTMTESMDAFGKMISDWITRGLMETGEANVISAANIEAQIAQAGLGSGANPEFARTTGVDIMLNGRYYLQENRLIIHSNIFEVATGEVLHALQPIEGSKDKMLDLLDQLTEEVLGYWAVKKEKRFLQNPPKYEAYQRFIEGDQASYVDFKKSEAFLIESYRLDSTFYAPVLKLIPLYFNNRYPEKVDSVIAFMNQRRNSLTNWEQLRLDAVSARRNGDGLRSAMMNEEMFKMDPSDEMANYNAVSRYVTSNYPTKALEVFEQFDKRLPRIMGKTSWIEARVALAYNRLGEYEKALEVAGSYDAPELYTLHVVEHLVSVIRLDSMELLSNLFENYLEKDIYNQIGNKVRKRFIYETVCSELYILDNKDFLQHYAAKYQDWLNHERPDDHFNQAIVSFLLDDYDKALLLLNPLNWPEIASRGNIAGMSFLGMCYAKVGQTEEASTIIDKIMAMQGNDFPEGFKHYNKAKIEVALDMHENAIASLKEALSGGISFQPRWFMEDAALKPLFDYPEFQEMVKPKEL